jgi:glycyl-tRNA synthetase beta chain
MTDTRDLFIEIGTEELPPKTLNRLSQAFGAGIRLGLDKLRLNHGAVRIYATPRRLAVIVEQVAATQPDKEIVKRGPALSAAFDAQGRPTQAALGFARSCGVAVEALERLETDNRSWLAFRSAEIGQTAQALIPGLVTEALVALPIPKRMRWGTGEAEFVRPIQWVVLLFGSELIEAEILGVRSDRRTYGHRFHHPAPLPLVDPARSYVPLLEGQGFVLPEFERRRALIREQVEQAAKEIDGIAVIEPDLLDEVTALVEWPAIISGTFDSRFLTMPPEVLIATMRDQQRYFHLLDEAGRLLPKFICVTNIESRHPETIRRGNERVIKPRLTDAAFFWDQDRRKPLSERLDALREVIFQKNLGTLHDKSLRIAFLARAIARQIQGNPDDAERAGLLSKCDLLTHLVGEFPELQGIMGRYYAAHDGESQEVAAALDEHYLPRKAFDRLPETRTGQALALADKLDTLVGIFGIGQVPSGDSDPFALRRAALGTLRILIEGRLDLDLEELLARAAHNYAGRVDAASVVPQVFDFMMERLRGYYLEDGVTADIFEAVLARRPKRPYDFGQRLLAVVAFRKLPEAESLASANKRIGNILRQATGTRPLAALDESLLREPAEAALARELGRIHAMVQPKLQHRDYTGVLTDLAGLRDSVDSFFDQVLVMCEDQSLRCNRLTLLHKLNGLFLEVADISRLQG